MDYELSGKVAVLIGAAGPIGEACAHKLAAAGAALVLADPEPARCIVMADELRQAGYQVHVTGCHPTDPGCWDHVADEALDQFGGLDVVIHTRPPAAAKALQSTIERFLEPMKPDGMAGRGGAIICVLTDNGTVPDTRTAFQSVRKTASECTRSGFGIRVNLVNATASIACRDPDLGNDIALAVLYLASDAAAKVSGLELTIDGALAAC